MNAVKLAEKITRRGNFRVVCRGRRKAETKCLRATNVKNTGRKATIMLNKIPFVKMHGIGNDYIYVDCFHNKIDDPAELARAVSDRHFGIGGDGLILICPSDIADVKMRMFDADGSEAEMCGNGVRCVARFAFDNGLVDKKEITVETLAGVKHLEIMIDGNVRVDMGAPVIGETLTVNGKTGMNVSMGNPHFVIVEDDIDNLDLPKLGPTFERAPVFPNRTNTEFIEIIDQNNIKLRVWERGSGETLACGTGACAGVAACSTNNIIFRQATVHMLGGKLDIDWNESNGHICMTGGATTICAGEYFWQRQK